MIHIYVRNKNINPSAYYRIIQYLEGFEGQYRISSLNEDYLYNISLNHKNRFLRNIVKSVLLLEIYVKFPFLAINDIKNNNVVYIQREIFPHFCIEPMKSILHKLYERNYVIWDFDDDIRLSGEISTFEYTALLDYANTIIVTNEMLKNKIESKTNSKIYCLPTTDGTIYKKINRETIEKRLSSYDEFKIVWVGTSINLNEVQRVIPYIEKAGKITRNKYELYVISGKEFTYESDYVKVVFVKWNRNNVAETMKNMHVGIMPLTNNDFNRGKGGFKLIQYLSASLPVIGDGVGINEDIISEDVGILVSSPEEWTDAIVNLSTNRDRYCTYANCAIEKWRMEYNAECIGESIRNLLNGKEE